jgi:NADH-quinone oxidoreductase subunit E
MAPSIEVDRAKVDEIIQRWGADPSFVIEMMQDIQDEYRHLPKVALERVEALTGTDLGQLCHIATFYKAFSMDPRGEETIQVCMGTACHVRGAPRVMDALSRELDIKPGGTTGDLKFSLDGVRCLGCCSLAPVVTLGEDLFSSVNSSQVRRLLRRHGKKSAGTDLEEEQEEEEQEEE